MASTREQRIEAARDSLALGVLRYERETREAREAEEQRQRAAQVDE